MSSIGPLILDGHGTYPNKPAKARERNAEQREKYRKAARTAVREFIEAGLDPDPSDVRVSRTAAEVAVEIEQGNYADQYDYRRTLRLPNYP